MLVIAFIALRNPKPSATSAGTATVVTTMPPSGSVPPSGTASTSAAASTSSASSRSATSSASSSAAANAAIGSQPLVVLNDTYTPNLARDAAARFTRAGWTVTSYDESYSNDIISTVAYYDPAVRGAKRAALALQKQFPTIKRVVERFPELPAGPVVVVLTTDYSPN